MTTTTRRALLAVSAAALPLVNLRAQSAPIDLKVSHYMPPGNTIDKWLAAWAAELDKRSNGRIKLRVYPAGQLGPVPRQFDLARNGQAELAVGLAGATPGRYPMTELSNLPFVFPSGGSSSAVTSRRLTELAPKYLASEFAGLKILWFGVTPPNTLFTGKREITAIADVKGLKMRFQGEQAAKVLRALGAVPVQVPPGDVADGMAKGVIDGAIFNYEAAEAFGVGPSARFVAEPPFSCATLALVMNSARYVALPAELRLLIDETTGPEAAGRMGHDWDLADEHGRAYLIANKVKINVMAPAELAKFKAALEPIVAEGVGELTKAGKPAQAFLDAYRA